MTALQSIVTEYAPDLRFMLPYADDADLMRLTIDRAVGTAVEEATAPMFSKSELEDRCADARAEERSECVDEFAAILTAAEAEGLSEVEALRKVADYLGMTYEVAP